MRLIVLLSLVWLSAIAQAAAPWGTSQPPGAVSYQAHRAVYDVSVTDPAALDRLLDRVSGLSVAYGADPFDASIVLVLHGNEMAFFDVRQFGNYEDLMRRAQSLTVGGIIEFRMCRLAAAALGLQPAHIHGFVQMVPMGDAEIVRLQQEEGYAYMH